MNHEEPPYKFFGRRKGKALRRRHLDLYDTLLPRIKVDLENPLPPGEVWLEIGFGGGEHLVYQAGINPHVNFIGAEPFRNGVAKLLGLIDVEGLTNIKVHDDDVRYVLEKLPLLSISQIFVLYPDPWPKKKHHERRILNADTLVQFHSLLKADGVLYFASDIEDYVNWTLRECSAHGGFPLLSNSGDPYEHWVETRYEAKAKREGRSTRYLTFGKK